MGFVGLGRVVHGGRVGRDGRGGRGFPWWPPNQNPGKSICLPRSSELQSKWYNYLFYIQIKNLSTLTQNRDHRVQVCDWVCEQVHEQVLAQVDDHHLQ